MTIRLCTVLAFLATLSGSARADSGRALDLDQLIDLSEEIVLGEVVGSTARWQGKLVVTDTVVRVDDALKGSPPHEVTVTQPGGTAVHPRLGTEVTTQASTFTAFQRGESVVLFVDQRAGVRRLVGAQQGKLVVAPPAAHGAQPRGLAVGPKVLRVEPGPRGGTIGTRGMTLDELRARVGARTQKGGPR